MTSGGQPEVACCGMPRCLDSAPGTCTLAIAARRRDASKNVRATDEGFDTNLCSRQKWGALVADFGQLLAVKNGKTRGAELNSISGFVFVLRQGGIQSIFSP